MSFPHSVPPLAATDLNEFRRVLVGLSEPAATPDGMAVDLTVRHEAVAFVGSLADLYGRQHADDPTKMWEHIVKALNVASVACDGRDFATFACQCLPPLQIDPERAACDDGFGRWLVAFEAGDARGVRVVSYLSGATQVAAVAFARNARKAAQAARATKKEGGGSDV